METAVNFWQVHGVFFLICIFFFPRLTMLLATAWGGLIWWLGWLFLPRITVAVLASIHFADTNIILVAISWFWAISGEGFEKRTVIKRGSVRMNTGLHRGQVEREIIDVTPRN